MAADALKIYWQSSSLFAKVIAGAVVLVFLALAFSGGSSCASHRRDEKADEKQSALKAESDAHRARADEWEKKAKEYAAQVALAEVAVSAAGAKAEAIAEKVKTEDAKLTQEMQAIGEHVGDPCDRIKRICVRLSIKPADCVCTASN